MAPSTAYNSYILQPTKAGEKTVLFLLIPAADMKPSQYLPLANTLQNSSSQSLWVAIAKNIVKGSTIEKDITDTISMTKKQGLPSSYNLFLAVHSQNPSGSIVQDFLAGKNNLPEKVSGLILLGSFLKRSYQSTSFPIPTLTVGAELDGVCRLTRIMEAFVHTPSLQTGGMSMVAVVEGMTHLQFASGPPSAFIEEYDLKPERSDFEVLNSTSHIISNYMTWNLLKSKNSMDALNDVARTTESLLDPLIKAYSLEGSYKFKPPCYENTPTAACQVGSQWTVMAMKALASLQKGYLADTDSFHPADEVFPTYHHPKIISGQCSSPSSCIVNITSVTDNIYYKDSQDSGLVPNSACEMRAKLKSRQSILISAGFKNVSLNVSDGGSWCKRLNQLAYNLTLQNLTSSRARARFEKFGSPVEMGDDLGCLHNGGLWIYLPMEYKWKEVRDGTSVLVLSSVQLTTDVDYPIDIFAGMHYCKLLSPARVAEWVYVDGLRDKYSLSGERLDLPKCGVI